MPLPDTLAKTGLQSKVQRLSRLGFFDFVGDPLRSTDYPYDISFVGNPDAELNGSYFPMDKSIIEIGPISHNKENSDTLTVTLSGLISLDATMMTYLGNRANWFGRQAIIWFMVSNEAASTYGQPWRHYTGRIVNVTYEGDGESSRVTVHVENYLANISQAANKTYLSQQEFDPADRSAAASIAAVNSRNVLGTSSLGGNGEGGGGGRTRNPYTKER